MKVIITMPDSWLDPDGTISDEHASDAVDYIGEVRDQIMSCCTSGHVDAETHWEIERESKAVKYRVESNMTRAPASQWFDHVPEHLCASMNGPRGGGEFGVYTDTGMRVP